MPLELEPIHPIDPPPPAPKTEFTQAELKTYDFTGWDWRTLPHGVLRAARNGGVAGHTVRGKAECVRCKNDAWAVDPVRENTCEACDFYGRKEIWDLRAARAKRNNMKPFNPFVEPDNKPTKNFWPLEE